MSTEPQRTCLSCGNEFSGAMEFCPVCMLRKGLADGIESGDSSVFDDTAKPKQDQGAQRFDHYELVTGEDGRPLELGRGAMGVTYKAFDINLHSPVTLKEDRDEVSQVVYTFILTPSYQVSVDSLLDQYFPIVFIASYVCKIC